MIRVRSMGLKSQTLADDTPSSKEAFERGVTTNDHFAGRDRVGDLRLQDGETEVRRLVGSLDTTDSFERSEEAESLGADLAAASEPFYRPELVERLRRQVSEGRYFVPADQIVEKLLGRLIVQRVAAAA